MEKAVDMDAGFLLAHKWRGVICGEMAQYEEAIRSFDAAIRLDPMNADLYVRRAKMSSALGRSDEALRDLLFASEQDPTAKRTLMYLGDVYAKADNAEKALACYDKAIAADAKYDDAYARKAMLLLKLKRVDEALAAIDLAIKVSTYKPERFWLQKGSVLEAAGRDAESVDCYVRARTLAPRMSDAWRKEALLLKRLGRKDDASKAAQAYLELVPSDAELKKEFAR